MDIVHLSVIMPSFDEMANLQKGVLEKVTEFLKNKKIGFELIVVDDGSTDGSAEFIEKFAKEHKHTTFIKNQHLGKAGAVTTGVLQAKGKYILFADMDQATPIEEMDKLLPYFSQGYTVVIGSRSNRRKGAPAIRLFISRANIYLRKLIVGLVNITDTQCGFKMFEHDAAFHIFSKYYQLHHGFVQISGSAVTSGFDVELLLIAKKMHYKIKEVPVNWLYVETRRVNPIKDSFEGVLDLLRIRIRSLKGMYT